MLGKMRTYMTSKEQLTVGLLLLVAYMTITNKHSISFDEISDVLGKVLKENFPNANMNIIAISKMIIKTWKKRYKGTKILYHHIGKLITEDLNQLTIDVENALLKFQQQRIENDSRNIPTKILKSVREYVELLEEHSSKEKQYMFGFLFNFNEEYLMKGKLIDIGARLGLWIHIREIRNKIYVFKTTFNDKIKNALKTVIQERKKKREIPLDVVETILLPKRFQEKSKKAFSWKDLERAVANNFLQLGARVKRNKRFLREAGRPEIDLMAEFSVDILGIKMPLLIYVECKKKKVQSHEVRIFRSKIDQLPTKPHIAMIIAEDFTNEALDLTRQLGIIPIKLGKVEDEKDVQERLKTAFSQLRRIFESKSKPSH